MGSSWQGERVRLRGVEPPESQLLMEFNDETSVLRNNDRLHPPRSKAGYLKLAETSSATPDDDEFGLGIEALDQGRLVGGLGTHGVDKTAGVFSYGIAIGAPFQRRGYATDAITVLLRYMFGERRFQKCNIHIYAFNTASLDLHRQYGFVDEGLRRRSQFFAGTYHDVVLLGLTVEEYAATHSLGSI